MFGRLVNILTGLLSIVFGALLTGWYGWWALVLGYRYFPRAAQAWGHAVHDYVAGRFLRLTLKMDGKEVEFFQTYLPSERTIFVGSHPSTVTVPSFLHALSDVTEDRHLVAIGKREYLDLFFWMKIGRWRIPVFPNVALPVFGLAAWRAKVAIFIDRAGGEKTLERIRRQVAMVPEHSNLLIFPEGTRFTPKKRRDPKHEQAGCDHTLRFNSGGLWAIMQVRPPSLENTYFWFDWACSRPDHQLSSVFRLQDAELHMRLTNVTHLLSRVHSKEELEIWLNSRRKKTDAFIRKRRS